jgi:phosphomannomutase
LVLLRTQALLSLILQELWRYERFRTGTPLALQVTVTQELIISVSGLRGVVGTTLTAEIARRYAAAFASTLPDGPVVVTRDGRANGVDLIEPVAAGLGQRGTRRVLDGGIAATPTTGILVRQNGCAGGVQISASHNPAEYNGLKLFSAEGSVVPATFGQRVLERFQNISTTEAAASRSSIEHPASSIQPLSDTSTAHLSAIERIIDVAKIRAKQFRVLLDANHGSGSVLGKPLLERLGCDVIMLGGTPDGRFAHLPEPTAENLVNVFSEVVRARADIGFCQDPDADRLAIIDERGRYLGEEYTLAICTGHVLRRTPGPVVTNCSTSRMTEDLAQKYGVPFFRSAVGEANVVDEMLRRDAVLGGEGNGGVIDPRVGLVRDSFVGMALVLDAMAARDLTASALAEELPRYAIWKTTIELPKEAVQSALNALESHFSDATHDRLDGLRLDWRHADGSDSWLLVRASNTEPIVRIIAEAPTEREAQRLCDDAATILRSEKSPRG